MLHLIKIEIESFIINFAKIIIFYNQYTTEYMFADISYRVGKPVFLYIFNCRK